MLNTRNIVIVVVLTALVSLGSACWSIIGSSTAGANERDSYGTRSYGYRGLFETLDQLHIPVERTFVPPNRLSGREINLVFLEPDPLIVTTEPAYLHSVAQWVKGGGTVFVSPARAKPQRMVWTSPDWPPKSPLEELSLTSDIEVQEYVAGGTAGAAERAKKKRRPPLPSSDDAVKALFGETEDFHASVVHATVDGELADRFPHGLELAVPAKLPKVITEDTRIPGSRVRAVLEPNSAPQILAAVYRVGEGTISVLADSRLAENALLGRNDNAVLVSHLLADSRRTVVFDEFYHGRTLRGNPLWLAMRFPYSALVLSALCATVLAGWRAARVLGPPLAQRVPSRRTLAEYIEAMARLLNRSRRPAGYLIGEIRRGLLWRLRRELGLSPGREDPEVVLRVLARRDPRLADNLREALAALDGISAGRPPASALSAALKKVSLCVSQ